MRPGQFRFWDLVLIVESVRLWEVIILRGVDVAGVSGCGEEMADIQFWEFSITSKLTRSRWGLSLF